MKDNVKQIISRRLIRLTLEMRDLAEEMRLAGFTDKAYEMEGAAEMSHDWAKEIVK